MEQLMSVRLAPLQPGFSSSVHGNNDSLSQINRFTGPSGFPVPPIRPACWVCYNAVSQCVVDQIYKQYSFKFPPKKKKNSLQTLGCNGHRQPSAAPPPPPRQTMEGLNDQLLNRLRSGFIDGKCHSRGSHERNHTHASDGCVGRSAGLNGNAHPVAAAANRALSFPTHTRPSLFRGRTSILFPSP